MSLRNRIRAFLGLNLLPELDARILVIGGRITKLEHSNEHITADLKKLNESLSELNGRLEGIHAMLLTAHAFDKPSPAPIAADWEQVSMSELADLIRNPIKEFES